MVRFVRLGSVALLSLFIGCSDTTGPVSLAFNRARWEGQNLDNYVYTGRIVCFCGGDAGKEIRVIVLSDTVFSASVIGTTVEQPKGMWLTVDQLFDLAQRSYAEKNYERVRVEYDAGLGYPRLIELSCSSNLADCGTTVEVKNLGPPAFDL